MISLQTKIKQVFSINVLDQSFDCLLQINIISHNTHKPHLVFENLRSSLNVIDEHHYNEAYSLLCQASFSEHMELREFPFDQQAFHIKFKVTNLDNTTCVVNHGGTIESFLPEDDWKLFNKIWVFRKGNMITLVIYAQRYGGFVLWNFMFPVFLLVNLSFVSFLLEESDFGTRFNIVFTLLLTLVASKLSITQFVPQTNYLTYLDKYMILAFCYMFLSAIQNTVVYCLMVKQDHVIHNFNRISGSALVGMWFVLHVVLCYKVYVWQTTKKLQYNKDYMDCMLEERLQSRNTMTH